MRMRIFTEWHKGCRRTCTCIWWACVSAICTSPLEFHGITYHSAPYNRFFVCSLLSSCAFSFVLFSLRFLFFPFLLLCWFRACHIRYNSIHSGLPREEFTELLCMFPVHSLKSLRADLFVEAWDLGLVPHRLPLADRRDSALRPVSRALSTDVWTLVQSSTIRKIIILKNGKRSQKFLQSQSLNPCPAVDQPAHEATAPLPTTVPISQSPSVSQCDTLNLFQCRNASTV